MKGRRLLSVGFMVTVFGLLVIQCGDDDPCDPDPCLERNGLQGTCQWLGFGDHWWCECIEGAQWNYDSKVCEGVVDRCVPDPCRLIAHAPAGTCVDEGDGDFSCDCDPGYVWEDTSNSCEDDPCDPDPCGIDNAVAETCVDEGGGDFSCTCESGFFWEDEGNTCEDPCAPDPCEGILDATPDTCTGVTWDDFTCDCDEGFEWDGGTNTCAEVIDA